MDVFRFQPFAGGLNTFLDAEMIPSDRGQAQTVKNCSVIDNVLRTVAAPTLLLSNVTTSTVTHFHRFGSGETSSDFFCTDLTGYNAMNFDNRKNAKKAFKRYYASKNLSNYRIISTDTGNVGYVYEVCQPRPAAPTLALSGSGLTGTYLYFVTYTDRFGFESPPSPTAEITAADDTITLTLGTPTCPVDVATNGFWSIYRMKKGEGYGFTFLADVASSVVTYADTIDATQAILGVTPTTSGYDFHPCPGGPNPIYRLLPSHWAMPTPTVSGAGNITTVSLLEFCFTATKILLDETNTTYEAETSPSPTYRLAAGLTAKQVEFAINLDQDGIAAYTGYSKLRLYVRDGATGYKWRLVDEESIGASVTLIDNTDDGSYTDNDNPYMKNGFDGCLLHNNVMIGWYGDTVYWSETGQPHLWKPDDWKVKIKYRVRHAISNFSEVVLFTDGGMYRLQINDPDNVSINEIPNSDVALYKSAAASPNGVYVVKDGLQVYRDGYLTNISNNAIKESDFPTDGFGVWHNGFYYYLSPTSDGIVADVRTSTPVFRSTTEVASAAHSDSTNGKLYLAITNDLYTWPSEYAPSGSNTALTWKSAIHTMGTPHLNKDFRRFSVEYEGVGRIKWYVDGTLKHTSELPTATRTKLALFLPQGTTGKRLEYQIDNFSSDGTTKNAFKCWLGELYFTTRGLP